MSERLKMGVVGLGTWGQNHPLVYDDYYRSEVAVVCDQDEDRAREVAELYNCEWTTSVDELVSSDVSAFSVATPDHAHFEPVSKLLQANKHVLVEKPLTTNLEEARELARLARTSSGYSMVDFHLRWNPEWSLIKDAVQAGDIGKPHMGYIRLSDAIQVAERWLSWASNSGPHWFLFPHIMDLMNWILDEEPEVIYSTGHRGILDAKGVKAWDAMQAMVTYPSSNVTFETSWVVPDASPSVTDCHMVLYGERAKVEYDQDFSGLSFTSSDAYTYPWVPLGRKDRWGKLNHYMYEPMRYFVDCVLDDVAPVCTFDESVLNVAMIEATVLSLEEARPVSMSELLPNGRS